MGAAVQFGIMGPLEVRIDGGEPLVLGGSRQRALLAVLMLRANELAAMDLLVDELWGERAPTTAVHTVQVFVSRLRRAMGSAGERLVTAAPGYVLRVEPDELDGDRCERLYREARAALAADIPDRAAKLLQDALALWRGPPLADFTYDTFAQAAIARLEELRVSCREELVEAHLALGRHAEVVSDLEDLVRTHPFRERAHGQLMLALYRCGRQADALEAFQRARHRLLEELAVEPSSSLRNLEQAILRQDPKLMSAPAVAEVGPVTPELGQRPPAAASPRPMPAPLSRNERTPFVGRGLETQLAHEAIDAARDGARRIIVIGGEPGVGKTRLAARAALEAHARGFDVRWLAASEGLAVPYGIWLPALSGLIDGAPGDLLELIPRRHRGELARLVPSLAEISEAPPVRPSDPETERYLMFGAVIALLEVMTSASPLALVLDDIHWADAPSLELLEHVAAASGQMPLLIVAAYRDAEVDVGHPLSRMLAGLHRLEGVDRVTLHGLSPTEVAALMAAIAGHELGAEGLKLAAEIATETDGNPFFVVQMLRHLEEHGEIAQGEDGRWSVQGFRRLTLPPSVREVVAQRVHRLGGEVGGILTAAAVIGPTFDLDLLAGVAGRPAADVLDGLEAAARAAVLMESAEAIGRFTFAHALFRRSLYDGLGVTRRALLHERIAVALEQLDADACGERVGELAHHWIACGRTPGKAVMYAQRAGDHALAQLAPDLALHWFTQALENLPAGEGDAAARSDILIGLGEAKRQVGDASFRESLLEASALAERLDDPERMTRAALANTLGPLGAAGPADMERIEALERTLARLPADAPHVPLLRAVLAKEVYYGGDSRRGVTLGEEALELARGQRDRRELASALSFTAAISPIAALDVHRARVSELEQLGEELADPELQFRASNLRFIDAMHRGDRHTLDVSLARMVALADAIGQPALRWTTLWARSAHEWIAGDLSAAEHSTREAAAVAQRHNIPDGLLITFGQMLAIRSEQDRLEELVEPLAAQLRRNPGLRLLYVTHAYLAAETGRAAEADAVLADLAAEGFRFEFDRTRAFNLARCADIALRVGAVAAAAPLYDALLAHQGQFATPAGISSRGSVELNLGRLASALGRTEQAHVHLEAALRAHREFRAPLLEARSLLALGEALLARAERERDLAHRADEALRSAVAIAREHDSAAIAREGTAWLAVTAGDQS